MATAHAAPATVSRTGLYGAYSTRPCAASRRMVSVTFAALVPNLAANAFVVIGGSPHSVADQITLR